jgi:hypothetical protein
MFKSGCPQGYRHTKRRVYIRVRFPAFGITQQIYNKLRIIKIKILINNQ